MTTYIFLVSVFVLILSPFFFIGFLIEAKKEKKLTQLRNESAARQRKEIAKQSR